MPLRPTRVQISIRKGRSSSKKRSSSCTELLSSKYMCLNSPNKLPMQNRVY